MRPECDVEPYTVHSFRFLDQSQVSQLEVLGLHHNHYSFDDFLKKYENFRERPDRYTYGEEAEYIPKLLLGDMVNDQRFSLTELREYFNRYIAYPDDEIERLKAMNPSPIITINSPMKLLEESRYGGETRHRNLESDY